MFDHMTEFFTNFIEYIIIIFWGGILYKARTIRGSECAATDGA